MTQSTLARVMTMARDLFPRNVDRLIVEYVAATKRRPETDRPTARAGAIRGRVRALRTDHAIRKWLYEDAALCHFAAVSHALTRLQIRLMDREPDDPGTLRLTLRLGRRYPLRDAILAGLDVWESESPLPFA